MPALDPRELLRRELTPELYHSIRELWKAHSIAEDQRDIPGLLATLTEDCVYRVAQTGYTWSGHQGATRFYTELLTAFPDIHFELTNIVIGPQGVSEEADVTATHRQTWRDFPATGRQIQFKVIIFFPWDPGRRKFQGETVYFDAPAVLSSRG